MLRTTTTYIPQMSHGEWFICYSVFCFFFLVRSPFPYVWQRELLKDEHQEEDAAVVTETPLYIASCWAENS